MFDVDVCYKIMFESMFEQCELKDIVEKICSHIHTSVFYVLNSGKIPAYACSSDIDEEIVEILEKGYITLAEYDRFRDERIKESPHFFIKQKNLFLVKADIITQGRVIGYSVIMFKDICQERVLCEVNNILCQVSTSYFEEEDVELFGNVPMRKVIYNQTVFRNDQDSIKIISEEVQGQYLATLFFDVNSVEDKAKLFQKISNVWKICGLVFDEHSVTVVFCGVSKTNIGTILERLAKLDLGCCVSELFEKLDMCKRKKNLLERMSLLRDINRTGKIMEEREWYISLVYTYALPMINEAGLSDDSIELLLEEDNVNNTELYDTLKVYLLCENNITATANKLHIHRNTLVYRLKQIRQIIDKDIDDNKVSRELLAYMMIFDISRQIEVK